MSWWVVKGNMEFMIQVMVIHSQPRLLSVFLQQMFKRKISTFAVSCFWNIYHWKLKHKNWTFFKRQKHISDKGDFLLWSSNNASKEVWVSGKGRRLDKPCLQTETGSETRENGNLCPMQTLPHFPTASTSEIFWSELPGLLFFECMMQTLSIYVHAGSPIWQSSAGNNIS